MNVLVRVNVCVHTSPCRFAHMLPLQSLRIFSCSAAFSRCIFQHSFHFRIRSNEMYVRLKHTHSIKDILTCICSNVQVFFTCALWIVFSSSFNSCVRANVIEIPHIFRSHWSSSSWIFPFEQFFQFVKQNLHLNYNYRYFDIRFLYAIWKTHKTRWQSQIWAGRIH